MTNEINRIHIYELFRSLNIDFSTIEKTIFEVLLETGRLYYAFEGDFENYGYIELEKAGLKLPSSEEIYTHKIANYFEEHKELLNKRGIRSKKWGNLFKAFIPSISQFWIDRYIGSLKQLQPSSTTFEIVEPIVTGKQIGRAHV